MNRERDNWWPQAFDETDSEVWDPNAEVWPEELPYWVTPDDVKAAFLRTTQEFAARLAKAMTTALFNIERALKELEALGEQVKEVREIHRVDRDHARRSRRTWKALDPKYANLRTRWRSRPRDGLRE
jgi:hypothetical protein